MKDANLGQIYQNLMITLMFAFVFFNVSPAQRNEMIKITMKALDSANQVVINVQTDSSIAVDTFKYPGIDTTKNNSMVVDTAK